jgi:hypothetical protein
MTTMDLTGTKMRTNLLDWAEKAGAHFHRAGHEWRSTCPLHGGNNNDAFAVYEKDGAQHWACYTGPCGTGDVYDFIQRWQDCDLQEAYQMLGGEVQPDPAAIVRAAAEQAHRAETALQEQIERAQRALEELRRARSWLTYHSDLVNSEKARRLWQSRGLANEWQDFWKLGVCRSFTVGTDDGPIQTPSLTIPIHDTAWQVVNVRHRLLNPPKPNDKYRPDRPGLQSAPFIANPTVGYNHDRILVVEGEIKSMVTYESLYTGRDEDTPQVIGIPGKTQFRMIADQLQGHEVYICFDPDAGPQALEAARQVHGKIITLPMKIDDAILAHALDQRGLRMMMKSARKI